MNIKLQSVLSGPGAVCGRGLGGNSVKQIVVDLGCGLLIYLVNYFLSLI